MKKTAENLYAQTEPVRYSDYLAYNGRYDEAIAVLRPLSVTGAPLDRARALTSWAEALAYEGDETQSIRVASEAISLSPASYFSYLVRSDAELWLGHDQAAFEDEEAVVRYAPTSQTSEDRRSLALLNYPFFAAARLNRQDGDFAAAADDWDRVYSAGGFGAGDLNALAGLSERVPALAEGHNVQAARQFMLAVPAEAVVEAPVVVSIGKSAVAYYSNDWRGVLKAAVPFEGLPRTSAFYALGPAAVRPLAAIATARLGDVPKAARLIARTLLDCDPCVRARGVIAAMRHDWHAVDYWFGLVAARSPSIPFADSQWGEALLAKGDIAGAIAKFRAANAISPHFADPLELWGEALMHKNRSDLALGKFEEANKYAPNWGRLHLEWGKALFYLGRKREARAQFGRAAQLDLSDNDKRTLLQWSRR